ncbi:MAG: DUF11 domain-containing protein, partial [Clostridia bacterium]|nr:DUF11 domain-containing protein [Clostridia bacterium]
MKKVLKNSALVTVLVLACTAATLFVSPSVDSKVYGAENGANTVDEVKVALQEVAYSYYMRGKSIQYNTMKRNGFFSPESATKQNTQYTVCSGYTQNIYHELLGISIPVSTTKLINYARDNAGNPEVAAFGEREDNGDFKLTFFDNGNKSKEVTNPTTADILTCLQPGDVLTCTGHAIFLYNLIYDDDGKITDAETIESTYGDGKIINVESKVATNVPDGVERFGNNNHYLYHGDGSLYYGKLSDSDTWTRLSDSGKANCSILRFIQSDTNGNAVLNYRGAAYGDRDYINEAIELNSTAKARIRFEKLYIEKTVDVFNDSIVEAGDKLTYTLTVKNKSRKDYTEDLKIIENIPENTTYNSCEADNSEAKITVDEKGGKIECNVGKLGLDHKVTLTYTVTVNKSSEGKTVISAGSVGGISTAEIYNPISKNLTKEQKAAIVKSCKKLTGKYSGKQLINAVYKDALGVNLGIDAIKVTDII